MENHLKLRAYIDDKYETKKDFIKRQTQIPCIYINPKDYEDFSVRLVDLEEVAAIKNQQGKLRREQRELEKRNNLLNRITIDKFEVFLNRARKRWSDASSLDEKQRVTIWLISKITVTNQSITAHINYDTITKKLGDFHMEIDKIDRDKMMKLWSK